MKVKSLGHVRLFATPWTIAYQAPTFTAIIGYQTLKYLEKEYKLQDILDGIELETDEDFEETCQELKSEITSRNKKKTAHQGA